MDWVAFDGFVEKRLINDLILQSSDKSGRIKLSKNDVIETSEKIKVRLGSKVKILK